MTTALEDRLAKALRDVCIDHCILQPDGSSHPDPMYVRRGPVCDAAREALQAYDRTKKEEQ